MVNTCVTPATGAAELCAALLMAEKAPGARRLTLGADKGYDVRWFVDELKYMNITPHVAQNTWRSRSIDGRTTRQNPADGCGRGPVRPGGTEVRGEIFGVELLGLPYNHPAYEALPAATAIALLMISVALIYCESGLRLVSHTAPAGCVPRRWRGELADLRWNRLRVQRFRDVDQLP